MANPQLENGYVKIATEILEALIKYRISGEEMKCLLFIIRKTYGWSKKQDEISLSQFVVATEMAKSSICRAINNLKDKNIIFVYKKVNRTQSTYEFNKKYNTWKPFTKKLIVYKKVNQRLQKSKSAFTKLRHTIDTITIETITKEKELSFLLYDFYKTEINPFRKSSYRAKKNITRHLKKYSFDDLKKSISNYKSVCGTDPKYRKDPANFFGVTEPSFVDYLPGNYEAPSDYDYDYDVDKCQAPLDEVLS